MSVPTSSYNPIIPQPTNQLSISQGDLLNNFGAIQTYVDVNHYDFGSTTTLPGKHFIVGLPAQSTNPPTNPSTAITYVFDGGEIGIYNFLSPDTSQQELYVAKTNSLGVVTTKVAITAGEQVSAAGFTNPGFTYLPSGYLLKWGKRTTDGSGNDHVDLDAVGPAYGMIFNIQLSYSSSSTGSRALVGFNSSPSGFDVAGGNSTNYYLFTIGM